MHDVEPKRWQQLKELFGAALERGPDGREAFLAQACAAEPELRAELNALLSAHDDAADFLRSPTVDDSAPIRASVGERAQPQLLPGELVADRFRLDELARRGGMGAIFRAHDLHTGKTVAIKLLAGRGEDAARFVREARALAELDHPSIVRYVAHGYSASGEPFLAMEWLDGEDLAERLQRAPLSIAESLRVGAHVAEALAAAHTAGVIHRDIKPSNLFLERGDVDRVRLLDFGVARLPRATRTLAGVLIGTPGYIAPEQIIAGGGIDARADLFALGCVLFECLTGQPAFVGEGVLSLLAKILIADAPRARALRPEVPEAVDELVARLLAKDPSARPASAAEVAAAIAGIDAGDAGAPQARLARSEQRLVATIFIGAGAAAAGVETVLARFGGRAERLADGATVVTLPGVGDATSRLARAARCALELRAISPDLPLALVAGSDVADERAARDGMIDRAVEPIGAAPKGGVRLGRVAAAMIETRFEIVRDELGAVLRGERSARHPGRLLLGRPTPFVGRDRELHLLEELQDESAREPIARAILVVAPAGVGKSRLLHELGGRLRTRQDALELWVGRGDLMSSGAPYSLLGQAVRDAMGSGDGSPAARRQALEARVARHVSVGERARVADFLGELTGARAVEESLLLRAARADAMKMCDQIHRAFLDWLDAETAAHPVVLALDDVHWGDSPSLKLVDGALRRLRDRPLLVVALGRPEVHDLFPALFAERGVQEVRLAELAPSACARLVRAALGDAASDETLRWIVEHAHGNAFFLEELIRTVAAGNDDTLPDSIVAVMQDRLDRLDPEARRLLCAASVFGRTFQTRGLRHIARSETALKEWLGVLEARELVEPRAVDTFAFRHDLLREAAYRSLTASDRALGHRLAAAWLESEGAGDPLVLAEHWERGEERALAAGWYCRASEVALAAGDLDAVLVRVARGVECGAGGELLGALKLLESEARVWRGELADGVACDAEAMRHLRAGTAHWYRAAFSGLMLATQLGTNERAGELLALLARQDPVDALGAVHTRTWETATRMLTTAGQPRAARPFLERLEAAAPVVAGDPIASVWINGGRWYWATYADWNPWLRMIDAPRSFAIFERAGDMASAWMTLAHEAWACLGMGGWAETEACARRVLAATAEGLSADFARIHLGRALTSRGALEEALAVERKAVAGCVATGNGLFGAMTRDALATTLLAAGELDDAHAEARGAVEWAPVATVRAQALATLSEVEARRGRTVEARGAGEQAAELLDGIGGSMEGAARIYLAAARAGRAGSQLAGRSHVLTTAARIPDEAWRARFLSIPEHRALLEQ